MEQIGINVPSAEMARLPLRENFRPQGINRRIIKRSWTKFKTNLISNFSHLSSFLSIPQFQQARTASNFDNWQQAGLDKFCNLGNEQGIYSEEYVSKKLGDFSLSVSVQTGMKFGGLLKKKYVLFQPHFEQWRILTQKRNDYQKFIDYYCLCSKIRIFLDNSSKKIYILKCGITYRSKFAF